MNKAITYSRTIAIAVALLFVWGSAATVSHAAPVALFKGKGKKAKKKRAKKFVKGKHKQHKRNNNARKDGKKNNKAKKANVKRRVKSSIKRTGKLIRVAVKATKEDESARKQLKVAVLHQRAARLAAKRKPAAALWLTKLAREKTRTVLTDVGAEIPAKSADRKNEFKRANKNGASKFIALAKKLRPSKEVRGELKAVRKLLVAAAKAVKEGGEGKDVLKAALKLYKAARRAGIRGKDDDAKGLISKASEQAAAALEANGQSAPTETMEAVELSEDAEEIADEVEEEEDDDDDSIDPDDIDEEMELEE